MELFSVFNFDLQHIKISYFWICLQKCSSTLTKFNWLMHTQQELPTRRTHIHTHTHTTRIGLGTWADMEHMAKNVKYIPSTQYMQNANNEKIERKSNFRKTNYISAVRLRCYMYIVYIAKREQARRQIFAFIFCPVPCRLVVCAELLRFGPSGKGHFSDPFQFRWAGREFRNDFSIGICDCEDPYRTSSSSFLWLRFRHRAALIWKY